MTLASLRGIAIRSSSHVEIARRVALVACDGNWPGRGWQDSEAAAGAGASARPVERLPHGSVQSPHGQLDVLWPCVLVLGVTEAAQALDENHGRRHPGPRHL